jgi:uncharacterized protein
MEHRSMGKRRFVPAVILLFALACAPGEDTGRPPASAGADEVEAGSASGPERGMAWVIFDGDTVRAEIAYTAEERATGLMHREELPEGSGMLFVFDDVDYRSFWMQNTYIPLDIAFLDRDGRIVDIQQMEPETTEMHDSAAPAMFALEVPQGWFAARGIEVGDTPRMVFGRF